MMLSLATLLERDGTLTRREFMVAPAMPAAIEGYRRALDRNPYGVVEQAMFEDDARNIPLHVRWEIADYPSGRAEDISLTRCTTEGLALVYHGFPLQPGDEVFSTTHDHYSHHTSIALTTARAGATMRKMPLFDDAAATSTEEMITRLLRAIGSKTRVVGLTWVHSSSGIRLPIREIAAAMRQRDHTLTLVVDGVPREVDEAVRAVHEISG